MKIKLMTGALAAAGMLTCSAARAELIINEMMQSNIDCIMDDLNEFPDSWVELYNAGPGTVNLSDYALSASENRKKAYALPSRTVAPGEYVVVYCDKEDQGLHTSFRLESGKDGAVYLFKGDETVDRVTGMKKQPAPNVAYGRATDGSDVWGYMAVATPGASNCGSVCKDVLDAPEFSHKGRVASEPFQLTVALSQGAPEGCVVRYTLDGTEPTEDSSVFSSPLNVDRTMTVRAKLFCDGYLSPRATTQNYIFLGREMPMPVVSIVTNRDYFYSIDLGIYNNRNNNGSTKNDWRRPVNLEVFWEEDDEAVVNQLCETRVKGGWTRNFALKSLALYANKRFGEKRFNYEFFAEDAPGLTDWKSIELRNSGNDFDNLYMRDAVIQRNMGRRVDLDWQPWQPAIVFINGEYKGMLNFRPRSNEDYVYTFYDGMEDVDVVENWNEVKEGDEANLAAFKEFYSGNNHTFAEYDAVMDVSEFCNLMILESFYSNMDFPGNNIEMWRPTADGGRWRWIVKDTDFGLGLYNHPYNYKFLNYLNTSDFEGETKWQNDWEYTRLWRRLIEVPEFRDMFIDRAAVYMGDFLRGRIIGDEIDEMASIIKDEFKNHHRPLFNSRNPNYDNEIEYAKTWAVNRNPFFYQHLADFFGLGVPVTLMIDNGRQDDVRLSINGVPVTNRGFNGKFFAGREMRLAATTADGDMEVTCWKVSVSRGAEVELKGSEVSYTIPSDAKSVTITTVTGDKSALDGIFSGPEGFDPNVPVDVVDASGASVRKCAPVQDALSGLPSGLYILTQGHRIQKVVR